MRIRALFLRTLALVVLVAGGSAAAVTGGHGAGSASAATGKIATTLTVEAPAAVPQGSAYTVAARLAAAGAPLPRRTVAFVERSAAGGAWRRVGSALTDAAGWARLDYAAAAAPIQVGAYFTGVAHEFAAAPVAASTVHVVTLAVQAPQAVRLGSAAPVAAVLRFDGAGVSGRWVHYLLRKGRSWRPIRAVRTDASGWARLLPRLQRTAQLAVEFEGAPDLPATHLTVVRVRVTGPKAVAPSGFVFPLKDPALAGPTSSWSQDQGVDLAAGGSCGSAAILVAVGDGVVIQEGISGFGPTAPVLQMTDGPFAGRNVYYGHTGRDFVRVGQRVHAGQPISEIGCGSVGYSSSPHLEIGVGVPGGPPCCPSMHETSAEMWKQLVASLARA